VIATVSGVTVVLTLAMGLSLYRVLAGPTIFDRLTGLSLIGTKSIILLLLLGVASGRADAFVDIALSYALISLVGAFTLAKYFERTQEARR
jgi:multicomponent Na+:H+ antiporter subunit F